jgi:8-oxo-dGTP diphosphatase
MIALVRHAAAGERRAGDDEVRPLTAKGRAQAANLVGQLASLPLARILSSPYLRCVQTVEPLAKARGLRVEEADALGEGGRAADVLRLMGRLAPAGAALCSHGDVIGALVEELVDRRLLAPDQARYSKGSTWLLEMDGSAVTSARYLPPKP